jgi:hypothetical protein
MYGVGEFLWRVRASHSADVRIVQDVEDKRYVEAVFRYAADG